MKSFKSIGERYRRPICCLCLTLGLFASMHGQAAAQGTGGADRQLTLLTPESSEFLSVLNEKFPMLTDASGFAQAKPFLLLLRNDTAYPVRAFKLRQEYSSGPGLPASPVYGTYMYDKFSDLPSLDADGQLFAPGAVRLVAPGYFDETVATYQAAKPRVNFFLQVIARSPVAAAASANSSSAPIAPIAASSIDAVIFSDGTMVGLDKGHLLESYTASQAAVHDEDQLVSTLLQGGVTTKTLRSTLQQHAAASRSANLAPGGNLSIFKQGEYSRHLGEEAQRLERIANSTGVSGVRRHVAQVLNASNKPIVVASSQP